MKWVKRTLGAILGLAIVGAIIYGFLPRPVPVETTLVKRGRLVVTVDEDARTRVRDRFVVAAPIAGELARVKLRAGDVVKAHDTVLATIAPATPPLLDARARAQAAARVESARDAKQRSDADVARTRTMLENARQEAERARDLRTAIAREETERREATVRARAEELRSAEFAAQVAQHEVDMALAALGQWRGDAEVADVMSAVTVVSPIDGCVLRVARESEGVVEPGAALLELGDPRALEVVVDLLSADAVKVTVGARVIFERWGGPGELEGRVRLIEPSAFTKVSALGIEEQRVNVIVDFVDPRERWSRLGDAYNVEARVVLTDHDGVLLAPTNALVRHGSGWAVFVVSARRAELRPVKVGDRNSDVAEILDGLRESEAVVAQPSDQVRQGVSVAIQASSGEP